MRVIERKQRSVSKIEHERKAKDGDGYGDDGYDDEIGKRYSSLSSRYRRNSDPAFGGGG